MGIGIIPFLVQIILKKWVISLRYFCKIWYSRIFSFSVSLCNSIIPHFNILSKVATISSIFASRSSIDTACCTQPRR